jgi:hypothetical protein
MKEEVAPPFEHWDQHLKALSDKDLAKLADEYRWLNEALRPEAQRAEFSRRREAIVAECDRRGKRELAEACRRPARGGAGH